MSAPAAFDVFTAKLEGIDLVEASAGTGKTWNICGVWLRLLLETNLEARQILVVTFTNAATAELRERIRSRIVQTLDFLEARGSAGEDPFVVQLVASAERARAPVSRMKERLELALHTFDEAAIYTIHGFCQRALADTPFAAHAPFELELLPDDRELYVEVARDFWRRHVATGCDAALAAYLAQKGDSPDKWAKLLGKRVAKPLATLLWPADIDDVASSVTRSLEHAFETARSTWQRSRAEIEQLLHAATGLHKGRYSRAALEQSFAEWEAYFAAGDPYASLAADKSRLDLCRATRLRSSTNRNGTTPTHAFCDHTDALFDARKAVEDVLARARLRLVRKLLGEGPEAVRQRKRAKRVLAYDDILQQLHRALHDADGELLAETLRTRYPAALIDEFQDTDPVQFGIFRAIYGPARLPLFLVGDPKQAIYSFRHADLHTYLGARKLATSEHTLGENQRSTGDLIDAVNALFGANPNAFILDGLEYHPVRLGAKPRKALDDRSARRADCCVWMLPREDGALLERKAASAAAIDATAAELARLLRESQAGNIDYDGRPLAAGDIAILVRSHVQGSAMRERLRALGIGSVELAQDSVFATRDAEEVERVLMAVLEPSHIGYLKSALATELVGLTAGEIEQLATDESALLERMQRFADYRTAWLQRGIGVALRKLLSDERVSARMLARSDGERRLTNLLHIGECLHVAASTHAAPDALLRWLHDQRESDAPDEVAQLRLESDRDLVKIVTIHKAKGLEYPIVFCPFLWDGHVRGDNDGLGACAYHDDDGLAVLDFRTRDQQEPHAAAIATRIRREALAEAIRLLYVALTRASHRCYLVAGCYTTLSFGRPSASESTRSMLNWLVAGAGVTIEDWCKAKSTPDIIANAWSDLAQRATVKLAVSPLPTQSAQPLVLAQPSPKDLTVNVLPRPIPPAWRIGSYTALTFDAVNERAAVDHDLRIVQVRSRAEAPTDIAPDDILHFPRGPLAGECLHAVFENVDFTDAAQWRATAQRKLSGYALRGGSMQREPRVAMIANMLRDVTSTPICEGVRLGDVPPARRLNELPFHLPSPSVTAQALNALLQRHGYAMPRLAFDDLGGYLKGVIDLVFEHGGRYYIADWKSNHLGYDAESYGAAAIDDAMLEHGYHLQHLLYALALHRYLARRLAQYAFARHYGGVAYLFVRGVRPQWKGAAGEQAGVYFHRLTSATLGALDALFTPSRKALVP